MPPVELLSKPNCGACIAVEHQFKQRHIPYVKTDMSKDPEAFERALALGASAAPVIIAGDRHAFGLDLDFIEELESQYVAA